jgi:hypothetical protein
MFKLILTIMLLDAKVSVFAQNQINYQPHYPKGFTWHFIETKAIKHDYYSSIIMIKHKNSRGKYWVVSQQALFFNAFLARHDILMILFQAQFR